MQNEEERSDASDRDLLLQASQRRLPASFPRGIFHLVAGGLVMSSEMYDERYPFEEGVPWTMQRGGRRSMKVTERSVGLLIGMRALSPDRV